MELPFSYFVGEYEKELNHARKTGNIDQAISNVFAFMDFHKMCKDDPIASTYIQRMNLLRWEIENKYQNVEAAHNFFVMTMAQSLPPPENNEEMVSHASNLKNKNDGTKSLSGSFGSDCAYMYTDKMNRPRFVPDMPSPAICKNKKAKKATGAKLSVSKKSKGLAFTV